MANINFEVQSYKGRTVTDGQEVRVYRNLTEDVWSIKMAKKPYHVLGHAESVVLVDCEYKVSEKGRQRVIREQKKYVHAVVQGKIVLNGAEEKIKGLSAEEVTYNPYKYETFVKVDTLEPIHEADTVYLANSKRVWSEL